MSEDCMKKTASLWLALTLACAAVSPARAQESESELVASGHDFALKVCAACHLVAKDQISPPILKPPAPSFSAILRRGDVSEASLRKMLSTPHGNLGRGAKMPNPQLADFQIDKIVAYLLSLKSGKGSDKSH
jgi:mono/diheme cytochrome c family protein